MKIGLIPFRMLVSLDVHACIIWVCHPLQA
jgi:hypothetical protein